MSRLICMELQSGRVIAIQGVRHYIAFVEPGGPMLTLKPESGDNKAIKLSRGELAALLVIEEAEFVDELEDPAADSVREVTNLSFMPLLRIMDWHGKVFMLRRMMRMAGRSPKSPVFRKAFEVAEADLNEWRIAVGIGGIKTWSWWTIYHDLQRWRSLKYSMAAIQRKGVEYCPWKQQNGFYEEARTIVEEIARENPSFSVAKIHQETNKKLSLLAEQKEESGHG